MSDNLMIIRDINVSLYWSTRAKEEFDKHVKGASASGWMDDLARAALALDVVQTHMNKAQEFCDDALEVYQYGGGKPACVSDHVTNVLALVAGVQDVIERALREAVHQTDLMRAEAWLSTTIAALTEVRKLLLYDGVDMYFLPHCA